MFSSLSRRRVILLVVLTCMLFITLDKRGNPIIDNARSVFARLLRPVDIAAEAVFLPVERAWYGVTNYSDLQDENAQLRDKIEAMKGTEIEARSAVLQLRELLKLQQLTSKWSFDYVAAEVVGDSPSNYQNTIEINVGSDRGVQVGMPVTDGAGLVGRITRVFPTRSLVLLITDPDYAIAVRVLSTADQIASDPPAVTTSTTTTTTTTIATVIDPTLNPGDSGDTGDTTPANTTTTLAPVIRETGTLEGQGGDKPMLLRFTDSISSVTSVRMGAVVDTAGGGSSLAPQGIPIGTITAIYKQAGSSSALVEVTPNADLRRLNFLAVVLYMPNQQAIGN